MGPSPWRRDSTRSPSSTPISGITRTASLPGVSRTSDLRAALNSRAFVFEPRPSGRRVATQCTTEAPAARADFASRAAHWIIPSRAISASCGKTARSPNTPFWHSWVTNAVCDGSTSSRRSGGMPRFYLTVRQEPPARSLGRTFEEKSSRLSHPSSTGMPHISGCRTRAPVGPSSSASCTHSSGVTTR